MNNCKLPLIYKLGDRGKNVLSTLAGSVSWEDYSLQSITVNTKYWLLASTEKC